MMFMFVWLTKLVSTGVTRPGVSRKKSPTAIPGFGYATVKAKKMSQTTDDPFLTGRSDGSKSVESLYYVVMESPNGNMAHLFERGGQLYLRLWEWAGQKDQVTLQFVDAGCSLNEGTHALKEIGKLTPSFSMRPREILTVQLVGSYQIQKDQNSCCKVETLNSEPEGWLRSNYFVTNFPKNKADQSPVT